MAHAGSHCSTSVPGRHLRIGRAPRSYKVIATVGAVAVLALLILQPSVVGPILLVALALWMAGGWIAMATVGLLAIVSAGSREKALQRVGGKPVLYTVAVVSVVGGTYLFLSTAVRSSHAVKDGHCVENALFRVASSVARGRRDNPMERETVTPLTRVCFCTLAPPMASRCCCTTRLVEHGLVAG